MADIIHPFGGKHIKLETEFCGRKLVIETGHLAFMTDGSVTVRYGDTVILGTAAVSNTVREEVDFFPLLVEYEERMYAAGKISSSRFIKREGRASDRAVLAARLIDRPIRPLFPKGYRNDVQGIATVLAADPTLNTDVIAMVAVSAALMISGAPFDGPVAGVRIGLIDGKLVPFPTSEELEKSQLDLVVAGTRDAIMMVEAGANEVDEDTMIKAIELAHKSIQPVIKLQQELVGKVSVTPKPCTLDKLDEALEKVIEEYLSDKLGPAVRHESHYERHLSLNNLKEETLAYFAKEHDNFDEASVEMAFEEAIKSEARRAILDEGVRPDNRKFNQIRPLSSMVAVLPRVHGSGLFTRGSTQVLNITTLGAPSYAQTIETMEEDTTKRFMHHYNFPPFSTGEARPLRSPGRREIGHGALAERAIEPVIPDLEEFPYAIRSVSEVVSSSGSTSMASVCAGVLSLMDAGVPIKKPVSGIAMGLMTDKSKKDRYVILSDIVDAEDFAGDMDFKVAGTKDGITALQMDIKITGITAKIMKQALSQAKKGRMHILKHILSVISEPRSKIAPNAPSIEKIRINPTKIRDVIGKGGETINKIIAETGAEIDIEQDGLVIISADNAVKMEQAIAIIKSITAEPEVGQTYSGKVTKVLDFGAFVEILPGKEGMVHISELKDERVERVTDVINEGDTVTVKLIAIDDRGRLNLSMKQVK